MTDVVSGSPNKGTCALAVLMMKPVVSKALAWRSGDGIGHSPNDQVDLSEDTHGCWTVYV